MVSSLPVLPAFSHTTFSVQADHRGSSGSVPNQHSKVNTTIKQVRFSCFPLHTKVMFTLYYGLLSVQELYVFK